MRTLPFVVPSLLAVCALSYAGEAKPADAIGALEAKVAAAGSKAAAADLVALADAYEKAGQPVQAAGALERATRAGVNDAASQRRLGRLNEASARWEQAVLAYKAAVAADPKAAGAGDLALRAARLMADTVDEKAASADLLAIGTSFAGTPTGAEALLEWYRRFHWRGDFGQDRERCEDLAVATYAGEGRLAWLIGNGARRMAERNKAAEAGAALAVLLKAAPGAAKQPEVLQAQATVLARTGKPAEAVTAFEQLYAVTRQAEHLWWAAETCQGADKPRAQAIYLRVAKECAWHWVGREAALRARTLGATREQIEPLLARLIAFQGDDLDGFARLTWLRGELAGDEAALIAAVRIGLHALDADIVAAELPKRLALKKAVEAVAADPTANQRCLQARCLLGLADGRPEQITAALREAGNWDDNRCNWWMDRLANLLDQRKADPAVIEAVFKPLCTAWLNQNLRNRAAEHAGYRLRQAKQEDKAKALQQLAKGPIDDPVFAAYDKGDVAGMAANPPAGASPLRATWLQHNAAWQLREKPDRQIEVLIKAADGGKDAWLTAMLLDTVNERQMSGRYAVAIAAGQAVAADHPLRAYLATRLAWVQLRAGDAAGAVKTIRSMAGEAPAQWSRRHMEVVARAAGALDDRALYEQVLGEALARGDGDLQRGLMWDYNPKEAWRQAVWKRLAAETPMRWLQAECFYSLGEHAKVVADYADVRDQRERSLCALIDAARGAKDAPGEDKLIAQLLEQIAAKGAADGNRVGQSLWYAIEARPKAPDTQLVPWLEAVTRLNGQYGLWAYRRLADLRRPADAVEAAVLVQRMVRTRNQNDKNGFDQVLEQVKAEAAAGRHGVAAAAYAHMAEWFSGVDDDRRSGVRRAAAEALAKLGGSGAATALIDDRDPKAPLLRAAALLAAGDEDEAYRQAVSNPKLLDASIGTLGADLLLLVARNRIREGEYAYARDILQRLIQARSGDKSAAESVARSHLLLGDIEFRNANFPAALLEFQAVTAGWPATRAAFEAGLRVGDAHLAARREADARKAYEALVDHEDTETRIQARFRLAMLEHRAGNEAAAAERFRQVSAMNPSKSLADQLYLDWGKALIEKNQLAEAENIVTLVGLGDRRDPVAPGESVRITLRDPWLQTSQNRTSVPVVVTTSAGDREEATLILSSDVKGMFVGRIPTALGPPKPGDRMVQVRGGDRITYDYTDEFKKGRRNLGAAGVVEVASDGELRSGSTPGAALFPGETAAEAGTERKQSLAQLLAGGDDEEAQAIARVRASRVRGEQVRPGGSVHVAVRDPDRAISDKPDRITALVTAGSGDEVQAQLVETAVDSGIFRAVVASRIRPADVRASDSAPGADALAMLAQPGSPDFDRADRAWIAAADRKAGKTVTADLKRTMAVDSLTWSRGADGADRRITAYRVETSPDGEWWTPVYASSGKGQAIAGWAWGRRTEQGGKQPKNKGRTQAGRMPGIDPKAGWKQTASLAFTAPDEAKTAATLEIAGSLLIPKAGRYEFALRSGGSSSLQIGGEVLIDKGDDLADAASGELRWRGGIELPAGHARLLASTASGNGDTATTILWKPPGAADFAPVPAEAVDQGISAEALKRFTGREPAASKPLTGRHGATVTFPAIDARFVRLVIDAWSDGDAPAIASLQVASAGTTVLPAPGIDYRKLAADDVLELSPGDEVTVSYVDEGNKSGQVQTLRSRLKATYEDGKIGFLEARTTADADGNLSEELFERYRFKVGERLAARITDADLDLSDKPDKVKVRFSSGEGTVEVDGVETGPATGVFLAEIQTAAPGAPPPADKRAVLTVPKGDLVRAAYADAENNKPGQPVDRSAAIREAVAGERGILIEPTAWVPQGAKPRPQPAGVPAGFELQRGAPAAQAAVVPGPVALVVQDAAALTSASSRVVVRLKTSGGAVCDVALRPSRGADGAFTGTVLVQLGDAATPTFRLPGEGQGASAEVLHADATRGSAPLVPLQGGETVTATYLVGVAPTADAAARDAAEQTAGAPSAGFRLAAPARLAVMHDDFEKAATVVHIGGKLFLRLDAPVADTTPERDRVTIKLTSQAGDLFDLPVEETDGHSGQFTGSVALDAVEGVVVSTDARFTVGFGDIIRASAPSASGTVEATVQVAKGADAALQAFARRYGDEALAARTQVRLAECHFELYRSQRQNLKELEKANAGTSEQAAIKRDMAGTLAEGVALLRRTLADYPANAEQDRILYLLGQFEQESGQLDAAIDRYRALISAYPASTHAPEAQYKIAQCYEERKSFDEAWEAYVRLGNRWPDHRLVADAMVRIGLYYQDRAKAGADEAEKVWRAGKKWIDPKEKAPLPEAVRTDWLQAGAVYGRMVARFADHPVADQTLLGQGNALFQARDYLKAKVVFDAFPRQYPSSPHQSKAMYWSGIAALRLADGGAQDGVRMCYLQFLRLLQDYPESTEAKLARGVLLEDQRFAELDTMGELKKAE